MERPAARTVDVRDMLCAQALAVVAKAMAPLPSGTWATVRYTTDDGKRDLVVWAKERGYGIGETADAAVHIEKR